ncbi:hypothetical protein RAZWK3B_00025 [Roseobacter sp. AzwK-3b]|uniref:hypothetical protein n=1 Tax=Roseobacter sp. AzwK-3b TaxID=351016 RepID=UPI000156A84F|nr:hypothetical protein [Roseobacter sp. AzwK-3b]EDM69888.1 hypothetical protein RAZWK3B_00025 [Roseobacter sp. AzwK-3b]
MNEKKHTPRNRANAQKSTGPKTAAGKATVAGNARKHGLTSRPDPELLKAWLSVILGRPEITPEDLMPQDTRGFLALTLAEAETRLVAVEEAFARAKAEVIEHKRKAQASTMHDICSDIADIEELAYEIIDFEALSQKGMRVNMSVKRDINGDCVLGASLVEKRYKLYQRYLGEAKSQRRRAFAAWVENEAISGADAQVL